MVFTIEVDGIEIYSGDTMPEMPADGQVVVSRNYGRLFQARIKGVVYDLVDFEHVPNYQVTVSPAVAQAAENWDQDVTWEGGALPPASRSSRPNLWPSCRRGV